MLWQLHFSSCNYLKVILAPDAWTIKGPTNGLGLIFLDKYLNLIKIGPKCMYFVLSSMLTPKLNGLTCILYSMN